MSCKLVSTINVKAEIGYTMWHVWFAVNGTRYGYLLNDREKWAVEKMAQYSSFKAFNYAKKNGERIKTERS